MTLEHNEYTIPVIGPITAYALSQTALRKSGPSGSPLRAVCDKASCCSRADIVCSLPRWQIA
jgi:hypothetical protein